MKARVLTVAQKHKNLVELAQNKNLGQSKIVCTTLIRGCGHLTTTYHTCATIFSGLAMPLVKGTHVNSTRLVPGFSGPLSMTF